MQLSNALLITASLAGDVLLWNVVSASKLLELIPAHGVVITSLSLVSNQLYGAGRCVLYILEYVKLYLCSSV